MANQKLTRARLTQLIIMLSLLLVAFFWRTFTYTTTKTIECQQKSVCNVSFSQLSLSIHRLPSGFYLQGEKSQLDQLTSYMTGEFIKVNTKPYTYKWLNLHEAHTVSFNKGHQQTVVNF